MWVSTAAAQRRTHHGSLGTGAACSCAHPQRITCSQVITWACASSSASTVRTNSLRRSDTASHCSACFAARERVRGPLSVSSRRPLTCEKCDETSVGIMGPEAYAHIDLQLACNSMGCIRSSRKADLDMVQCRIVSAQEQRRRSC